MARLTGCGSTWAATVDRPARLLERLGLAGRHAEALGHGIGDVAAAHEQDADEARDAALVDDDVGDAGTDVDQRLRLDGDRRGAGGETCERSTAKPVRSTIDGRRPACCTASSALSTMSRAAATSRTRRIRAPLSSVRSSSGWKSRIAWSTGIGMKSCTWKARDARSSLERQPRQVDLAHDDPLVGDAHDDLAAAEACLRPQLAHGVRDDVSASTTSPSRTAPAARATWPKRSSVAAPLPRVSSAARTPDVPMSSPTTGRPATSRPLVRRPDGPRRSGGGPTGVHALRIGRTRASP